LRLLKQATRAAIGFLGVVAVAAALLAADEDRRAERDAMVAQQLAARDVHDSRVLEAFRVVPRHHFVPAEWQADAYGDGPLPIGEGQTISQPYVVAKMTELLRLRPSDRVFELGTGSGYQAAVASRMCEHVYSVEIQPRLAERAGRTLRELGYTNVSVRVGDGFRGWPEAAPFDAMLITAAVPKLPDELLKQLKAGGRAVLPVSGSVRTVHATELAMKQPSCAESTSERARLSSAVAPMVIRGRSVTSVMRILRSAIANVASAPSS
jgi:protein-L-isoaspartate(D-aspartate) O-methyltransferase